MPSVRDIRRRIRSVENTGKVTNAMSLIAASKMRRAQLAVTDGRPYAEKIHEVIATLAAQPTDEDTVHPLLETRPVNNVGMVVITPDRGLAGGMHANINRQVARFILGKRRYCPQHRGGPEGSRLPGALHRYRSSRFH